MKTLKRENFHMLHKSMHLTANSVRMYAPAVTPIHITAPSLQEKLSSQLRWSNSYSHFLHKASCHWKLDIDVIYNYPKKLRTSATWSAKSSTEGTGSSGLIVTAPNCNASWKLSEIRNGVNHGIQWIINQGKPCINPSRQYQCFVTHLVPGRANVIYTKVVEQ